MKINMSKQMMMLATVLFFTMGFAIALLPLPLLSKCFILLAFAWYWYQQCEQHIFLKKPVSIKSLDCDENQRWSIETQSQETYCAELSPKSVATAHWMCLYFVNDLHKKKFRVLLSSDSLSKKDWSLLQLLVKFARPLKSSHA
jgi:hypothetical protein